ncbi:Gfo/Idh/MocA family oxidoreductase [Paenibacillus antri]|uniref:Gfo/Idh/MocA family oxidoreductase n=1 Tax=Paenibacillus antri TaxID=2582848 RepID=A0A5R9GGU0_9BACL|nr:Gfo/Idh/MocA family oxidoreductase [Paenibacillus antri]TLS53646.1 Gfo/Idh/MocA family oxidoreductase [Paenibacillus antri]
MKVAIVGCGGMGTIHASCYQSIPDVTVVGVHDIDPDAMRALSDRTGATPYASFAEMLEQSGCEAVSIATPSHLHKAFAVRTAAAGKHVISEKPIALTLEDAEEVIRTCERYGVRLFVGHVVRYFPEYAQMKAKVEAGELGRIGVVHAKRAGAHPGDRRPWFKDAEQSGGVALDLMIHDLDFLRWTLGEVRSVYGLHRVEDTVEYASATLVFESGAVANAEAYWGYPGPFHTSAEIAGSRGVVRNHSLESASLHVRRAAVEAKNGTFVEVPQSPGYHSPYELELRDFIDCIRSGRESEVTGRDAYKALELALAVMESAKTGKAVVFDRNLGEGLR